MMPRLRRLVHDKLGADKAKEVLKKDLKQQMFNNYMNYKENKNIW